MKIADIHFLDYKPKNSPRSAAIGFPPVSCLYRKDHAGEYNERQLRIHSEYKTSPQYCPYNNIEEDVDDNDVEYVLVKEPSSRKRRWNINAQFQQKSNSKREGKKRKRNFTLEDIQPKQQKHEQELEQQDALFSSGSTASASTSNSNKNITQQIKTQSQTARLQQSFFLFNTAIKSRFDFVNDNINPSQSQSVNIPQFIIEIINKSTSSLNFFKQFHVQLDINYDIFIEESHQIKSWNMS